MHGKIDIGFNFNSQIKYIIRLSNPQVLGDFYCMFDCKSQFTYKSLTNCQGFFLRKAKILDLLSKFTDIQTAMLTKVKKKYMKSKVSRALVVLRRIMVNLNKRKDVLTQRQLIEIIQKKIEDLSFLARTLIQNVENEDQIYFDEDGINNQIKIVGMKVEKYSKLVEQLPKTMFIMQHNASAMIEHLNEETDTLIKLRNENF